MSDRVVTWCGYSFRGNAEIVACEIENLGKEISPNDILEYAESHPESELYKCFTWDDGEAAQKYRLFEARQIVCHLKVTYISTDEGKNNEPIRVFLRNDPNGGYKKTEVMVRDIDERANLLKMARAELEAFVKKYRSLSELEAVFEAIESL